jgi:DNA-directed RNA polymerase specialized sigma24 family protein
VIGIDEAFSRAREGDAAAFATWMGHVERPIRERLRCYARAVDVEVVMQETFLRMWILATRRPERQIEGENASLRFALGVARNVALEEVRRARLGQLIPLEDLDDSPELTVDPDPPPDPGLARAIEECMERVPRRSREALLARLNMGHQVPDRMLAKLLRMTLNTFFQNIVRARRSLLGCLEGKGVHLEGLAP